MELLTQPSITALRESLRDERLALEQSFLEKGKVAHLLSAHSRLIDQYLQRIWQQLEMPPHISLVAVGGYGRGELYPKSDVDLLILLDADPSDDLQQKLQALIGSLWDIGLDVGHSIRTLKQCQNESTDITVQTNLLEARWLSGDMALFQSLQRITRQQLNPRTFFLAKLEEQQQRHARFLDADYNLEPNLKESPGGLRDLQTVAWIMRATGIGTRWSDLVNIGLISPSEARQITRHDRLLQRLRTHLHYLSKRREDRLEFEFQTLLAERMNIKASAHRRASEHLMQHYYKTRQVVSQFNTILLQTLRDHIFHDAPPQQQLNERFRTVGTLLEIRDEALFSQTPEAIFELFLLLQKRKSLTGFSTKTLRALWRAPQYIDAEFRRNTVNRLRFMEIFRQPQDVVLILKRMNQYGILGRYIPAFGRIVGQMQHDLFHVYTVDEHTLMVVRNLRRFALPEFADDDPLCSKLLSKFARPEILYIAGLFHDIAKGRGGDHAQLGKKDARAFCVQHQIRQNDTDLVVWLVEQHLTLSSTAQKQDISDPEVIHKFAKIIKNDRYLVALYLLTVADVRGTSPKVWNAWKASLFENLFSLTRRYLRDGETVDQLQNIQQEATQLLNLYALLLPSNYQFLWAQLEDSYFLAHQADEIAWHTQALALNANTTTPIVKARLSRIGEGLQVMVYCPDQESLFVRICNFFARMNFTIDEAKVHTTEHGYVLNSFQIMEAGDRHTSYKEIMSYIEWELTEKIKEAKPVTHATGGRINRQLKHFPINNRVHITQGNNGLHILSLVAGDHPGLLASIALILDNHSISLHRAKINTLGNRIEDVFWISGTALNKPRKLSALRKALQQQN
jgi:[protein-PII] uridylyltransferase